METPTAPSSSPKDIWKYPQLTADALGHETVTIKVCPEENIFTVHKKLGAQSKLRQYIAGVFAYVAVVSTTSDFQRTKWDLHIQTFVVFKDKPELFQLAFEWQRSYGDKFRAGLCFSSLSKELGRCLFHVHGKGEIYPLQKDN